MGAERSSWQICPRCREELPLSFPKSQCLKDPGLLLRYHQDTSPAPGRANRPVEIDANLSAVEAVLEASP